MDTTSQKRLNLENGYGPYWWLLYAPIGFGSTSKLYALELKLRELGAEFYYPCVEVGIDKGVRVVKPLFNGYAFIHCSWSTAIEEKIVSCFNLPLYFVKESDTVYDKIPWSRTPSKIKTGLPLQVRDLDFKAISELVESIEKTVQSRKEFLLASLALGGFDIGDTVRITKGPLELYIGNVIEISPQGTVIVEVDMFGRKIPITILTEYLEKV